METSRFGSLPIIKQERFRGPSIQVNDPQSNAEDVVACETELFNGKSNFAVTTCQSMSPSTSRITDDDQLDRYLTDAQSDLVLMLAWMKNSYVSMN
jgi:hypothetical protein